MRALQNEPSFQPTRKNKTRRRHDGRRSAAHDLAGLRHAVKAVAAPEEAILFLFVQQRRGEEGLGDNIGWCVNLTQGHGGQEPPGSNPILARYTLSPVNHDSVLGMRRNGDERSRRVSLSSESWG